MTAPNHALTGALIGLTVTDPWLAIPLAFLSHFACDAIPHYDPPGSEVGRIGSRRLVVDQLLIGGTLCIVVVVVLAAMRPTHWLLAVLCAFLAASPDLFWIPRWLHVRHTGRDVQHLNWFLRIHSAVQWKTGPRLWWVEGVWALCVGWMVAVRL
ncbi:MAG TPA: hypothetical protein VMB52_00135 [Verrucomicrobiae bacterium]|nr:hypothetical protein [Verrucomicrobiae bacterium]